jgi:transaldolase
MMFFLDTADIKLIEKLNSYGLVDGVTTNPSIIAKSGQDFKQTISKICQIVSGPVSAEVMGDECEQMLLEAEDLIKIAPNVCIKLPTTMQGLKACKILTSRGIQTNLTLCFSLSQAIMVAKAGATFVSPFVGRWDDISTNGLSIIQDIKTIYKNYGFKTKILAASIRHNVHVIECAKIGADVVTLPPAILEKMISHPLTNQGIEIFKNDWKAANNNK